MTIRPLRMRRPGARAVGLGAAALAVVLTCAGQAPVSASDDPGGPGIERVNVSGDGAQADEAKWRSDDAPAISSDGRYVAFSSTSDILVPGDTNGALDVFVRDRQEKTTERVNVSSSGAQASGETKGHGLALSPDGRYVVFASNADNLVAGDTWTKGSDLFLHDRQARTTVRIGTGATHQYPDAAFSPDGRYLSHTVHAKGGLVLYDMQTRTSQKLGTFHGSAPSLSTDARRIAFTSDDTNLVPGDTNGDTDVFVYERQTGAITRANLTSTGGQAVSLECCGSFEPAISADGRIVAFESDARNMVPDDTNQIEDMFVRDLTARTTERVSVASDGTQGEWNWVYGLGARQAEITADGRYVFFASDLNGLVTGFDGSWNRIYRHDRQTRTTSVVSDTDPKSEELALNPAITPEGRHVAFSSDSGTLVPGDTNGDRDIFVRTGSLLDPARVDRSASSY
ncbi:TolB family protein [Streptomyces sp. NPDC018059]|uniref:TolB family protein n=1 Tax=Streptomyces sp. NPDC018059 TaxID=3365041 RepID=UPI0037A8353C